MLHWRGPTLYKCDEQCRDVCCARGFTLEHLGSIYSHAASPGSGGGGCTMPPPWPFFADTCTTRHSDSRGHFQDHFSAAALLVASAVTMTGVHTGDMHYYMNCATD